MRFFNENYEFSETAYCMICERSFQNYRGLFRHMRAKMVNKKDAKSADDHKAIFEEIAQPFVGWFAEVTCCCLVIQISSAYLFIHSIVVRASRYFASQILFMCIYMLVILFRRYIYLIVVSTSLVFDVLRVVHKGLLFCCNL